MKAARMAVIRFQSHATMEPRNTTMNVREEDIEVSSPTQIGSLLQEEITVSSR